MLFLPTSNQHYRINWVLSAPLVGVVSSVMPALPYINIRRAVLILRPLTWDSHGSYFDTQLNISANQSPPNSHTVCQQHSPNNHLSVKEWHWALQKRRAWGVPLTFKLTRYLSDIICGKQAQYAKTIPTIHRAQWSFAKGQGTRDSRTPLDVLWPLTDQSSSGRMS